MVNKIVTIGKTLFLEGKVAIISGASGKIDYSVVLGRNDGIVVRRMKCGLQ